MRGNLAGRMDRAERAWQDREAMLQTIMALTCRILDGLLAQYEAYLNMLPPAFLTPGFDFDLFEQVFAETLTAGGYDDNGDPGAGLRLKMHAWDVATAAALRPVGLEVGR